MKRLIKIAVISVAALAFSACCNQKDEPVQTGLVIEKQGVFSSGGRITDPILGDYDATQNWMDQSRKGTTTHVDHANTFYQIPADGNGNPIVFLHGYGQFKIVCGDSFQFQHCLFPGVLFVFIIQNSSH